MNTAPTYADKLRADHRLDALRPPVRGVSRRHAASSRRRPVMPLADVVRLPAHATESVPMDGTRVQANHRIALPTCCDTLGWTSDTALDVEVGDGAVLLRPAAGAGDVHVRVRAQLTLSPAMRHALGVAPGDTVVAVADPAGTVRLLGPAALADAQRMAACPRPVRDALNQLAPVLTTRRLAHVLRLLTRVDDADLERLASLHDDELADLLAPTQAPPTPGATTMRS